MPFAPNSSEGLEAARKGGQRTAEIRRANGTSGKLAAEYGFGAEGGADPREAALKGAETKRRLGIGPPANFKRNPLRSKGFETRTDSQKREYLAKAYETRLKEPQVINGAIAATSTGFKSFAQKIRHKTNDGWELIDAVYEVFLRAREMQADQLIMDSATWLADRGFGKPVQVGQLLDGEGNPVAFTLWSPATQEPIGDVITIQNGKVVDDTSASAEPDLVEYQPRPELLEAPKPYEPPKKDGYADGVACAWSKDTEPRKGE